MGRQKKSKRQLVRDEKRKRKRDRDLANEETAQEAKRQRFDTLGQNHDQDDSGANFVPLNDGEHEPAARAHSPEREFFGLLANDEQEYFRRADELLELNDFPSAVERQVFLQNIFQEARGKALKLASSQSCSRLMERLILLATVAQKKWLFAEFSGHFLTLVTHRFASHCCEMLFTRSAPVVTEELLGRETSPKGGGGDESEETPQSSMEDLFLLMLDELEGHLSFLLSDRYASHTLRVLLVILSGRPLDSVTTKSLLQSKKKEHISVKGAPAASTALTPEERNVPSSFIHAARKIITDSTASMDSVALRVLATHRTGNPVLQLLLELDIFLNVKSKEGKEKGGDREGGTLLERLLPGAPASLSDSDSQASVFVSSMVYEPIGSRLLETVVTHCPGKIFKGLYINIFGPRMHIFLRNDIASYPAIKVLGRLSKEDLVEAVQNSLPFVPLFINKGRFNVLKALFERCHVRDAIDEIEVLMQAIRPAFGSDSRSLVPKLCYLDGDSPEVDEAKEEFQQDVRNKPAIASHACGLVVALLGIPGSPSTAVQTSLLSLDPRHILQLATSSHATASILAAALTTPSQNPTFHKALVNSLTPNATDLAGSQPGHSILNAIVTTPSKGEGISVPFHLKEAIMAQLADHERELRDSWTGRNVWRTWKGDLWRHRRTEWIRWAKEFNPEEARNAVAPKPKKRAWGGKYKVGRGGVDKQRRKGFPEGRTRGDVQRSA